MAVEVQLVMNAWMKCSRCVFAVADAGAELWNRYVQSHLFCDKLMAQFQVLKSHTDRHALSIQQIDLSEGLALVAVEKNASVKPEKQSMYIDSSCRYYVGSMVTYLHKLVKNVYLYSVSENDLFERDQLNNYIASGSGNFFIFSSFLGTTATALKLKPLIIPGTVVVSLDEEGRLVAEYNVGVANS